MHVAQILDAKGAGVATISPDASVADAVASLAAHNCGALVVSPDGRMPVGILSERDIVRRLGTDADALGAAVADLMVTDLATCRADWEIERVASLMTGRRIRHLPVVDDSGALAGIVSIGDVVKLRLDELEREREQLVDYIRGS